MIVFAILPIFFSTLLLAAHFYRADSPLFAVMSLLALLLLLIRNQWVPRLLTIFLFLAAAEWLRTMLVFIGQYQEAGMSWTRLAIILTSVSLFTALSTLVFRTKALKSRYRVAGATQSPSTF